VDGVVRGVEAVNAPGDFMAGRLMIVRRKTPNPAALADLSIPLKTLAAA
jgi:3-phenylpropionate/trans-cinnamate dioxygenase ferredoxin reductase subunit